MCLKGPFSHARNAKAIQRNKGLPLEKKHLNQTNKTFKLYTFKVVTY